MTQKTEILIPEWMMTQNSYSPRKDREGFLSRTLLGILKLFRHFHVEKNEKLSQVRAGFRTLLVIGIIVLTSLSRNPVFCGAVAAGFLLYLSSSKIDVLKRTLGTAVSAAFFTALIMLPAFLLYKSDSIITITGKVFLSTGIVSLYAQITPWNKITGALRFVKIPEFIIFILDLTIHYILILGNCAYEMLSALKLRSVGRNMNKQGSFSGILGSVFLKSIEITKETQEAMECRLFDGSYRFSETRIRGTDFLPLLILVLYLGLFIIC